MLDFSFSELAVIGAVALVVLGPEKLPKVARTAGQWISKAQRYVNDVKADIQRETELADLKKLQEEVRQSAREMENAVHQNLSSIESDLGATVGAVKDDSADPADQPAAAAPEASVFETQGEFVKPPPTLDELAAELAALRRDLAGGGPARFRYAPRARAGRRGVPARRTHLQ